MLLVNGQEQLMHNDIRISDIKKHPLGDIFT